MALIRDDQLADDDSRLLVDDEPLPGTGRIVVSLARWQKERETLLARNAPIGVRLKSDESPEAIAADLDRLALVELEFPKFRDGRAYTHARSLRERYGYRGEVRAVGDVLMEQLHFMLRTGFNAFEIAGPDPLAQYRTAKAEFSVWYQPTGDGRPTAINLRHRTAAERPGR